MKAMIKFQLDTSPIDNNYSNWKYPSITSNETNDLLNATMLRYTLINQTTNILEC